MSKPMPIVLFGTEYLGEVVDFDALARHGTINREESTSCTAPIRVDDAYEWRKAALGKGAGAAGGDAVACASGARSLRRGRRWPRLECRFLQKSGSSGDNAPGRTLARVLPGGTAPELQTRGGFANAD